MINEAKQLPLQQYIHQSKARPVEEPPDDCDDRTTRSNTPSLTYGSTTSGASSLSGRPFEGSTRSIDCEIFDLETRSTPTLAYSDQQLFLPAARHLLNHSTCERPDVESDSDNDSDDGESSNDDWSGQEDEIEPIVLSAVGNDLELAAYLIPILHQQMSAETSRSVNRKVGIWQSAMMTSYGGQFVPPLQTLNDGTTGQSSSGSYNQQSGSQVPRKRRRSSSSDCDRDNDEDEADGDDKEDGDGEGDGGDQAGQTPGKSEELRRLACPFHKLDPKKYAIQYGVQDNHKKTDYKTCSGPGFKSIQRLKCYVIFRGPERSACMAQLVEHRQTPTPCERGDDSSREGISDAQWEKLDGKKGKKGSQEKHRLERWFEIWRVLFPSKKEPKTPWYEASSAQMPRTAGSPQSSHFLNLFNLILDQKKRDMIFPPGLRESMEAAADTAFRIWWAHQATSTESTSSRTRSYIHPSLIGGSSTRVSSQPSDLRYVQSQSSGSAHRSQASSGAFSFQPPPPAMVRQRTRQTVSTPQQPSPYSIQWTPLTPSSPSYPLNNMGAMPEGSVSFQSFPMDNRSSGMPESVFPSPMHDWSQPQGVFSAHSGPYAMQPTGFPISTSVAGGTLGSPLMEESMDTLNDLSDPIPYDRAM
ncbi:hypothetical protein SUNI508_04507 [Seiridium unicorne]|uniref:Uncharacterized protein n=1 Tax=Seiridium unicorne TaxID=138068 RepID=A0ABR2V8G5_9PEZI